VAHSRTATAAVLPVELQADRLVSWHRLCRARAHHGRPHRWAISWTNSSQNDAALNFSELSAETLNMPVSSPHPPPSDRRLVFTSSQAARYLGVSLATVRRWTDAGHISCYRTPGGQRRFSRDQLDHFITSLHRDGPTVRSQRRERSASVA
jgi:excisionase family DNA binding protein